MVSMTAEGGGGLVFRQSDAGYYAFAVFPEFVSVSRVEALKKTELARWALSKTSGRSQKIEVRCQENDCTFYLQETLIGRTKDATFTQGRVGLYLSGKGDAVFNDFTVQEIK